MTTFVTDNAANMVGARREVMEAQLKKIKDIEQLVVISPPETKGDLEQTALSLRGELLPEAYGCSAHLLNLWFACKPGLLYFFLLPRQWARLVRC